MKNGKETTMCCLKDFTELINQEIHKQVEQELVFQ
ncbi:hypothetical protein EUBVEN_02718 [Eubacterium ventriosum ATCC 27560]|uniref:Uncharacterized protein n=1 Tax=Eubacterium ventriosum ATCC 27560 TaxID=411463 RepID=A5ZAH1_9FIRM|nr:hypothetical protein EUBVEN_02718 [Eubacterium ventriosum ATCC 27560]